MSPAPRVTAAAWIAFAAALGVGAVAVTAAGADVASTLDWQSALGWREPWRWWTAAWVHWNGAHLAVNLAGAAVLAFVGWRGRMPVAAAAAWFAAWPLTQVAMALVDGERLVAAMPHYGGLSGVLHAGAIVLGLSLAWPPVPARPRRRSRATAPRAHADAAAAGFAPGFAPTEASALEPSRLTEGPWAMTEMGATGAMPLSPLDQPAGPDGVDDADGERPLRERWIGVAIVVGTVAKVVLEAPWDLAPRPSATLGIAVAPLAHACGIVAGLAAWGIGQMLPRRRG